MSELPPPKGELTPKLQDPDFTNPYAYPIADIQQDPEPQESSSDPQIERFKSSIWKRAGQVQAALGSLTQVESWQESGQQAQGDADHAYREAQARIQNGQASWIHGEYERWMGLMSYAVGHVVGDPEMQAKASLRSREGKEEIERVSKQ
ncbi:unnamed protein product [Rhizopus stolonifer]